MNAVTDADLNAIQAEAQQVEATVNSINLMQLKTQ